jgi:hypothetical protein
MKQFIVKYIYVNLFEISKQKILNWKKIFNNNIPNHTDLVKKKNFLYETIFISKKLNYFILLLY